MYRGGPKRDDTRAEWKKGKLPQSEAGLHDKYGHFYMSEDDVVQFLELVLQHANVTFGGEVFLQIIGQPQGTNCGPSLANIYLFVYEVGFLRRMHLKWGARMPKGLVLFFVFGKRFIDDCFFVLLDGFDWEDCLVDRRGEGGTDGL